MAYTGNQARRCKGRITIDFPIEVRIELKKIALSKNMTMRALLIEALKYHPLVKDTKITLLLTTTSVQ